MSETIEQREHRYITEALKFIDTKFEDLTVLVEKDFGPTGKPYIKWSIKVDAGGEKVGIDGQYILDSREYTHLSVIMTAGISRHQFGYLIFETLSLSQMPGIVYEDHTRNSLFEMICRYIIYTGMKQIPKGQMMERVKHALNFVLNVEEIYALRDVKKGDGNGKVH